MPIKEKLSHAVESVSEKVTGHSSSHTSHHSSVNTASKTPTAYPAGATHPPPGEKSINGAKEVVNPGYSHKDFPSKTVFGGGGKHDVGAKEALEERLTHGDRKEHRETEHKGVKPVTDVPAAAAKPVTGVPAPAAKTAALPLVPATAAVPATTVPVAKVVEADAYAVLPPGSVKASTTGKAHEVSASDGLRDVKFHLSLGGGAHKLGVKGSWDNWEKEVDCSGEGGTTLHLKPGTYQYKYIMDGNWINDASGNTVTDPDGHINNVMVVE